MTKILKQRQEAGPLEKLVADLPNLLIGLYGMSEQSRLKEEEMKTREDMALLEITLQNLAMQSEQNKTEIAGYETAIKNIEEEFQTTTTYLPDVSGIQGTSDGSALKVLDSIENAVSAPMYDAIEDRVELVMEQSNLADQYKNQHDALEVKRNALRYMQGNMAQNLASIAGQGGDPYMVDAVDLDPYWESTLLPSMKSKGMIPSVDGQFDQASIDEYKSMWSGMLAPQTTRYAQRETIIKNRESVIKQGIKDQNIMDIAWDQLPTAEKDKLLKDREFKLGQVVGPQINAMSVGQAGKLASYKGLLTSTGSQDNDYVTNPSVENFKNWGDDTQVAWMNLQKEYQKIGALLLNTKASKQVMVGNRPELATIENSFDPNTQTWADPMLQKQVNAGKAFYDSFNAISKEKGSSEHLFMEQLKLAQQFLTVRVNQASGMPVMGEDGQPQVIQYNNAKDKRRKRDIMELFGLRPEDYDSGVLDAILEQYEWIQNKRKMNIMGLFNDLNPTAPANNLTSEIPIEELFTYEATGQENQVLDKTVAEALAEAENEWII